MTDLNGHGTAEMRASGCACEWCDAWERATAEHHAREKAKRTTRLLAMVTPQEDPDECWIWNHALTEEGYARLGWKGWSQLAHRVAYELLIGPIPEDMQIDHQCRTRSCINPRHLQAVTSQKNNENRAIIAETASGFRNVHWSEKRQRYCVVVRHERVSHWGGSFVDKDDAIAAARDLRNRLHTNNLADA
ncbi:MAG TPA: HNH endonuclease signature motif containing protein [Microbacterium sp.]|nr:HNH endonuclease signature motif containing protein [Microbacterium sp.]